MEFKLIPTGAFTMGKFVKHEETLTQPFNTGVHGLSKPNTKM